MIELYLKYRWISDGEYNRKYLIPKAESALSTRSHFLFSSGSCETFGDFAYLTHDIK